HYTLSLLALHSFPTRRSSDLLPRIRREPGERARDEASRAVVRRALLHRGGSRLARTPFRHRSPRATVEVESRARRVRKDSKSGRAKRASGRAGCRTFTGPSRALMAWCSVVRRALEDA